MKNIVGQIASKEDFYPRDKEIRRIAMNLEAGANLQIAAPRRVGKSSILYYLKDNPMDGFHFVYIDVEGARSSQDYYRKIYKEILRTETSLTKRIFQQLKDGANVFLKRLRNVKLTDGVVELDENVQLDYEEELLVFLQGLNLEGERLVIMVDEFPEVILNIVEDEKGDNALARKFLQSNRALRNHDALRKKVQFIYTGSNSLNVTAAGLGSTELINDLPAMPVEPLSPKEVADLVTRVLKNYNYSIEENELDYLIKRVEWFIPFYFQLMIQEIINLIAPEQKITNDVIDTAFAKIFEQRNDHHFEHYVKRINRVFRDGAQRFVKLVLDALAQRESLSRDEAINMAYDIIPEDRARRVLSSLIYDGYIVDNGDKSYKFNSPILKTWWYNHEC